MSNVGVAIDANIKGASSRIVRGSGRICVVCAPNKILYIISLFRRILTGFWVERGVVLVGSLGLEGSRDAYQAMKLMKSADHGQIRGELRVLHITQPS